MAIPNEVEIVRAIPRLAPRAAGSNKGNYGRVLVVAGSRGMSGAAILCGSAALRGGAGLVRLATPAGILPIVASGNPCYMTMPLPEDEHGRLARAADAQIVELMRVNTVAALGPGLGQSDALTHLVLTALAQPVPLILDADGLGALEHEVIRLGGRPSPLIITPHPGEFGRLIGMEPRAVQARRQELAAEFARQHRLIVVLKGQGTVVTDGRRLYINPTGNPGMATGGTGDVLTGLLTALLGQGLEPFAAAQLAVYCHGLAGDLARDELGEVGLTAADLLDYLPKAINRQTG